MGRNKIILGFKNMIKNNFVLEFINMRRNKIIHHNLKIRSYLDLSDMKLNKFILRFISWSKILTVYLDLFNMRLIVIPELSYFNLK